MRLGIVPGNLLERLALLSGNLTAAALRFFRVHRLTAAAAGERVSLAEQRIATMSVDVRRDAEQNSVLLTFLAGTWATRFTIHVHSDGGVADIITQDVIVRGEQQTERGTPADWPRE